MSPAEAANQFEHRLSNGIDERYREARRKRDAKCVPISRGIFDGDETALAGNPEFEEASGTEEAVYEFQQCRADYPASQFLTGEITKAE